MKFATRYLIWIFYGIDRCDRETELSWVLSKNYSSEKDVGYYIGKLLGHALVIRMVTLAWLYFKFNSKISWKRSNVHNELASLQKKPVSIDYYHHSNNDKKRITKEKSNLQIKLQFESHLKYKTCIAWRNLTLYRSKSIFEMNLNAPDQLPILRQLNGQLQFGTLTALMGMSGTGKTSLLKVLNGQNHSRLSADSQLYLSNRIAIQTAFIAQEVSGHLMRGLTARQMLIYASKLKNQASTQTVVDHESIALKLLDELNLTDIANNKVEHCSGGERKRLALGLELTSLQMPNLICIDEATSGLDSNSAEMVISTLRSIARHHSITLVVSIHQPNTAQLLLFDQLYVLARGGVCVYSGPPDQIEQHFRKIPDIAGTDCTYAIEPLIKYSSLGHDHAIVRQLSEVANKAVCHQANCHLQADTQLSSGVHLLNRTRFSFHSVFILTHRYFAYIGGHLWKQWLPYTLFYISYGFNLSLFFDASIALPSGCMSIDDDFNATCLRSEEEQFADKEMFSNLQYNVFFSNMFLLIVLLQTLVNIVNELELFFNEHRNGWYSTGCFYLSKMFFEIVPILPILCVYVSTCNIYEAVQPGIYPHIVFVIYLTIIATQAHGYICYLACNCNLLPGLILGLGTYLVMLLLGNVYNSLQQLPYIYQLVSYFSIPRFTIQSLVLLEYGFGRCKERQIQPLLYWMDLEDEDYVFCIGMLLLQAIFYRCLALWMLTKNVNAAKTPRWKRAPIVECSVVDQCSSV